MGQLIYLSTIAIVTGLCAALVWHGAWLALSALGLLGLAAAVVLYLWGALTGRIDPFPLCARRR